MTVVTITTFSVKISGSATPFFLSFDVTLLDSKCSLKISSWNNILVSAIRARNDINKIRAVTRQATSNIVHCTSNPALEFIIRYKIIVIDITFITIDEWTFIFVKFKWKQEERLL